VESRTVKVSDAERVLLMVFLIPMETVEARFADNDLDIVVMVLLTEGVKVALADTDRLYVCVPHVIVPENETYEPYAPASAPSNCKACATAYSSVGSDESSISMTTRSPAANVVFVRLTAEKYVTSAAVVPTSVAEFTSASMSAANVSAAFHRYIFTLGKLFCFALVSSIESAIVTVHEVHV